jgi:glycosyltransferase involved in cell wall biosynthesis
MKCWVRSANLKVQLYLPETVSEDSVAGLAHRISVAGSMVRWRPERLFGSLNRFRRQRREDLRWSSARSGAFLSTFYSTYGALSIPQLFVLQDMIYERYPALFPAEKGPAHMAEKARCAAAAAAFVTPSAHALADARCFYDLGDRPARVIPYAVADGFRAEPEPDVGRRVREQYTGGREYILFVGARGGHKNFAGLLAAYARWPGRRAFQLLAAGGQAPDEHDAALVESFGMGAYVHFAPAIPESELIRIYHGCRAVVVPSLSEGYGFPVIEALATRRPVAASTGGSLPEVGGDAALYFDPRDGDSLLRALQDAVDTAPGDSRLTLGRERAESRTWDQVAREYEDMILDLVKR